MPRITAATVEAHREAQRRAILDAARVMVLHDGIEGLRFAEIGEKTGLARPSIYEYFRNRSALVQALIDDEFPVWHAEVARALASARDPVGAVAAFVRVQLELVLNGQHDVAFALMRGPLDAEAAEHLRHQHAALLSCLGPALSSMGVKEVELASALIARVVEATAERMRMGMEEAGDVEAAVRFATAGALALGGSP